MGMNPLSLMPTVRSRSFICRPRWAATLLAPLLAWWLTPVPVWAEGAPALLDDFSAAEHTTAGAGRLVITDQQAGGQSTATTTFAGGVLHVEGALAPGRGMPGFVSMPLLVAPDGQPRDLSAYEGIRLRVKVLQGVLTVQAASAAIDNFDFHTGPAIIRRRPVAMQDVRIPFAAMRRGWSEQVPLDLKTITSINLVAAGMAPAPFAYEIDEIGFY